MLRPYAFGKALARARRGQGFHGPYAFYRSRGGRKALGLTFPNYLSLERGRSLPQGWRLKRLLSALGLAPQAAAARELVRAYLADVLGGDDLLRPLLQLEPLVRPSAPFRFAAEVTRRTHWHKMVQLTIEQHRLLAADPVCYACYILLKTYAPGFAEQDLARLAKVPAARVRKAAAALVAAGLARRQGSRLISPIANRTVSSLVPTPALAGIVARLQDTRRSWVAEHGRVACAPSVLIRASCDKMTAFQETLAEAVDMATLCAENARLEGTAVYLVEGRIARLFCR